MNCQGCKALEARMIAIEAKMKSIEELVVLLEDLKGALRVIVKIGKCVKWVASVILACSGITWTYRHFGSGI